MVTCIQPWIITHDIIPVATHDIIPTQERSVQDKLPVLPLKISMHVVRLLQLLMGQPPQLECLTHIYRHLLVPDVNDVKLVTAASVLESSIVAFDGEGQGKRHWTAV